MQKPPPPLLFVASILAMAVGHLAWPLAYWLVSPWNLAGLGPIAAGIVVAVAGNLCFRRQGTPVNPFSTPTSLVVAGPFRVSRNPMYLGLTLALTGIALLFGSVTALLPVPVFVAVLYWMFIRREERVMEQAFGAEYVAYKRRVRRWL